MISEKLKEKLINYEKALSRLTELIESDSKESFLYDATIKRFEFTYEMSWKLLKVYLDYKGVTNAKSPRDIIKESFAIGVIEKGEKWLDMIEDRNITSHTYDEDDAFNIYTMIKEKYYPLFSSLREKISNEVQ